MALQGNLRTMPLTDLLQWLGTSRKTGTLRLQRAKVAKILVFHEGTITACSSDDPPEMLGHYLVARGKISEETLRLALARQATSHQHLGKILVEMNALSVSDLTGHLTAKAEETIYSLFDWEEAEFLFDETASPPPGAFAVELRIEEVLLRGLKRYDESRRIRAVFRDPGIVLRKTDKQPPPGIFENRAAHSIFELVTGDRTVAEILLHAHGSEFLVTKFLFELFRAGIIEIVEVRELAEDAAAPVAAAPVAAAAVVSAAPALQGPRVTPQAQAAPVEAPPPASTVQAPPLRRAAAIGQADELDAARALIQRGDYEGACDVLNGLHRSRPADEALSRLLAEAEAAFVEKAYRHYFPPGKVPVLKRPIETLTGEDLSPVEFFLLSRMNGSWDVRSIVQITPIREVDALRTLRRLREKDIVELRDPE